MVLNNEERLWEMYDTTEVSNLSYISHTSKMYDAAEKAE